MKKVKSTSFAGYTAEEIEAAGKHDLKVIYLGSISMSQFSAIFADFRRKKIWRFSQKPKL
jgi:hypothetical protein